MEEFYRDIAKMLLDIIKYIITGVLLTTMLGNFEDLRIVYVVSLGLILILLITSYSIYTATGKDKNINQRRRK